MTKSPQQLIGEAILKMSEFELLIFSKINPSLRPDNYKIFTFLTDALEKDLLVRGCAEKAIQPLIRDIKGLNKVRNVFAHEILLENKNAHPGKLFLSKNRKDTAWFKILDGSEIEELHNDFLKKADVLEASLIQIYDL